MQTRPGTLYEEKLSSKTHKSFGKTDVDPGQGGHFGVVEEEEGEPTVTWIQISQFRRVGVIRSYFFRPMGFQEESWEWCLFLDMAASATTVVLGLPL